MGTLIFHIVLLSAFILADIDIKGNVQEQELFIEFPDILPQPEQEMEAEETENEDSPDVRSDMRNNASNVASNQSARENTSTSVDEFFNEEYLKEIEAAKKLVSDVNNQLKKEIVDLDDIKMPVQSTDGMERDSIKNVVYAGESNIKYYLENRYHIDIAIPVYLAQSGGKVIVDIVVNQQGRVIKATPRSNSAIRDEQIFVYAQAAAQRTVFNTDYDAPEQQKGTIHYTFIAQ